MTSIKIKKWKKICDPKTGKMILIPPSILSIDWWYNLFISIREKFYRSKVRIWNGGLLLWWHRLWIREDEFDFSLSMDHELLAVLSPKEQEKYRNNRVIQMNAAHKKSESDLQKSRIERILKVEKSRKKISGGNIDSTKNKHVTRESLNKDIDKILEDDHETVFFPELEIVLKIKK